MRSVLHLEFMAMLLPVQLCSRKELRRLCSGLHETLRRAHLELKDWLHINDIIGPGALARLSTKDNLSCTKLVA